MKIIRTTDVADRVLKTALALLKESQREPVFKLSAEAEIVIVPYANGRERGWTIEMYGDPEGINSPAVSFSEARGSEEIVIYPNSNTWRSANRYGISEEAWAGRQYVKPGPKAIALAAKAVVLLLFRQRDAILKAKDAKVQAGASAGGR